MVRTNFSADFLDFSQFLIAISRKLWRHAPNDEYENYVVHLSERAITCEKNAENHVEIGQ